MLIKVPVSVGELADKITILEIKKNKIKDKNKLFDIEKELLFLKNILKKKVRLNSHIRKQISLLKKINLILWNVENNKRSAEKLKKFDKKFITLARNVYKFNDKRAKIKLIINNLTGSEIIEVKSYE
jgi:hypothetical protein|tara:strand:+ start:782 stop:1162 length:381 start_codon:yes stop_codon:yes gene_type:complete